MSNRQVTEGNTTRQAQIIVQGHTHTPKPPLVRRSTQLETNLDGVLENRSKIDVYAL